MQLWKLEFSEAMPEAPDLHKVARIKLNANEKWAMHGSTTRMHCMSACMNNEWKAWKWWILWTHT